MGKDKNCVKTRKQQVYSTENWTLSNEHCTQQIDWNDFCISWWIAKWQIHSYPMLQNPATRMQSIGSVVLHQALAHDIGYRFIGCTVYSIHRRVACRYWLYEHIRLWSHMQMPRVCRLRQYALSSWEIIEFFVLLFVQRSFSSFVCYLPARHWNAILISFFIFHFSFSDFQYIHWTLYTLLVSIAAYLHDEKWTNYYWILTTDNWLPMQQQQQYQLPNN